MAIVAITGYGTVTAGSIEELKEKIRKLHEERRREYENITAKSTLKNPEEVKEEKAKVSEESEKPVDIDSLSREELVQLAEKYGVDTYKVRTDVIKKRLVGKLKEEYREV